MGHKEWHLEMKRWAAFRSPLTPWLPGKQEINLWLALEFLVTYLFADCTRHRHWEWPDIAAAQVLPFALVTEKLEFSLLLIIQTVAVAYLQTHTQTARSICMVTSVMIIHRSVCVISA